MQINYNDILSNQQTSTSKVEETGVAYATNPSADIPVLQMHQHSTRDEFYRHYKAWMDEIGPSSDTYFMTHNAHFLKIVQLGERAVPYIMEVIDDCPGFIYWALNYIYPEIKINRFPAEKSIEQWKRIING